MLISPSWTWDASCRLISWHARDAPSAARARTRALVDLGLFVPVRLCALTVVCCLLRDPGEPRTRSTVRLGASVLLTVCVDHDYTYSFMTCGYYDSFRFTFSHSLDSYFVEVLVCGLSPVYRTTT